MSYDSLRERMSNRIKTTMIGAISSIEEHFGFLWGYDEKTPTKSQQDFKRVFEELRKEILDKGNNQLRSIDADLCNYNIDKKEIKIVLPVNRRGNNE